MCVSTRLCHTYRRSDGQVCTAPLSALAAYVTKKSQHLECLRVSMHACLFLALRLYSFTVCYLQQCPFAHAYLGITRGVVVHVCMSPCSFFCVASPHVLILLSLHRFFFVFFVGFCVTVACRSPSFFPFVIIYLHVYKYISRFCIFVGWSRLLVSRVSVVSQIPLLLLVRLFYLLGVFFVFACPPFSALLMWSRFPPPRWCFSDCPLPSGKTVTIYIYV